MTILRDISTMWACCFSFVMFLILFEPRLPMRRTVLLSVIIMGPLLTANFALLFLLGPETMSTLLLITATLPSLVFFWFLAKYRDGRFFFTFCMSDTIMLLIIHSTTILDFFLGDTYILMFVLRLIACPLLAWASYRLVPAGLSGDPNAGLQGLVYLYCHCPSILCDPLHVHQRSQ